jgi:hypothetical protein
MLLTNRTKALILGVLFSFTASAALCGGAPDLDAELAAVERVSAEHTLDNLDNTNVVLVDTRRFEDMIPAEKIPGALVVEWDKPGTWAKDLPKDAEIITYCA